MRVITLAVMATALWLQGCNIINPSEEIPTFIRVDSFKVVSTDLNKTGSTSNKVSSVWAYIDNELIGAFDVPGNIPVLGQGKVLLTPGVTFSGLKSYQILYPFYTSDTFTLSASPGKTIQHVGKVTYTDAAIFQWREDFETGNGFIKINDNKPEDTSIVRTSEAGKVFEGGGTGYMYMTPTHPTTENMNNRDITVKAGDAYLEINYKCSANFEIGLQTTKSGQVYYEYIAGVKANSNWNKLYVGLQPFIGKYEATAVRVLIKSKLPDGAADAYVLIDNLKILTY